MAVHGTRRRDSVSWDHAGLLKLLAGLARDRTGLPVLRCYWYETAEGRRTSEHDALAEMPGLKLRLVNTRPGRREGIESQVRRDLVTLAKSGAISDAFIASADEHLAELVSEVQDLGLRVVVLHIASDNGWTIPQPLRQECDDIVEISGVHLRPFVDLIRGAEPSLPHEQPHLAASAATDSHDSAGAPVSGALSRAGLPAQALPVAGGAHHSQDADSGQGSSRSPYDGLGSQGAAAAYRAAPAAHDSGAHLGASSGPQHAAYAGNGQPGSASSGNSGQFPVLLPASGGSNAGQSAGGPGQAGDPNAAVANGGPAHAGSVHGSEANGRASCAANSGAANSGAAHGGAANAGVNGGAAQNGGGAGGSAIYDRPPGQPPYSTGPQQVFPAQAGGAGQQGSVPAGYQTPAVPPGYQGPVVAGGYHAGPVPPPQHGGPGENGTAGYQHAASQNGAPEGNSRNGSAFAVGPYQAAQQNGGSPVDGAGGHFANGSTANGSSANRGAYNGSAYSGAGNGAANHDRASNGAPTGGTANGAAYNGGAYSGAGTGAANYGSASDGGTSNGGASNGGAANGRSANGSSATGGAANAGAANGAAYNGGAANGGAANGGGLVGGLAGGGQVNGLSNSGAPNPAGFHAAPVPGQPPVPGQSSLPGQPVPGQPPVARQAPMPAQPQQYYQADGPHLGGQFVAGREQGGPGVPVRGGQPAYPPQYPQYPPQQYQQQHYQQQQAAALPAVRPAQPVAVSLADAVKAAHNEGFNFGESVSRDAPGLWLEAVLARKPRMPSDLEARLLQGSVLPIDSLLQDEVRHSLRRGFWDALEGARR